MNITTAIADSLLLEVDKLAQQLGISRDQLFEKAIAEFLAHKHAAAEEALNAVWGKQSNRRDPGLAAVSQSTLDDEDW